MRRKTELAAGHFPASAMEDPVDNHTLAALDGLTDSLRSIPVRRSSTLSLCSQIWFDLTPPPRFRARSIAINGDGPPPRLVDRVSDPRISHATGNSAATRGGISVPIYCECIRPYHPTASRDPLQDILLSLISGDQKGIQATSVEAATVRGVSRDNAHLPTFAQNRDRCSGVAITRDHQGVGQEFGRPDPVVHLSIGRTRAIDRWM